MEAETILEKEKDEYQFLLQKHYNSSPVIKEKPASRATRNMDEAEEVTQTAPRPVQSTSWTSYVFMGLGITVVCGLVYFFLTKSPERAPAVSEELIRAQARRDILEAARSRATGK